MKEMIDKIKEAIKKNPAILYYMIGALVLFVVFLFGKKLKRLFFARPRRRRVHRTVMKIRSISRGNRARKQLPRSVGTKGYPAAGGGYIPFKYNKDGTVKKAWQVGGTLAAKSRMSRLRKRA